MTGVIGCTVLVDGKRFADGSPGDPDNAPTALSGLSVTWGRGTTLDQPQPSTCEWEALDPQGGAGFLDALHVGQSVRVIADAATPSGSGTFIDPHFLGTADGATPANVTPGASTLARMTGNRLRITPTAPGTSRATLAPAPFDANPAAWDGIPRGQAGEAWQLSAAVLVPTFARLTVTARLFTGPTDHVGTLFGPTSVFEPAGADWPLQITRTITATTGPLPGAGWVGLDIASDLHGPRWNQVAPPTTWATLGASNATWTWQDTGSVWVDTADAISPVGGGTREGVVFAGRITDMTASWSEEAAAVLVNVTCADFTAGLGNRNVGEVPWAVEAMAARFNRVLTLAGLPIGSRIDAGIGGRSLSWQDVDSQGALALLTDYATSVDGVLWSAVHATTGAYLWVEDVAQRQSGAALSMVGGIVVIIADTADRLEISACDVLLNPVTWNQDTTDVLTRVAVGWQEQTLNDDGLPAPTEHTYTITDAPAEVAEGTRLGSLSTLLISQADAAVVALRILSRAGSTAWRVGGLVWDTAITDDLDKQAATVMALLDGTTRNGAAIALEDLPWWTPTQGPAALFVEGGRYAFTDGAWILELTVSNALALGRSLTWAQLNAPPSNAWRWMDYDHAISWTDLVGVGSVVGT
jgi:hypothetical protein